MFKRGGNSKSSASEVDVKSLHAKYEEVYLHADEGDVALDRPTPDQAYFDPLPLRTAA